MKNRYFPGAKLPMATSSFATQLQAKRDDLLGRLVEHVVQVDVRQRWVVDAVRGFSS